MMSGTAFPDPGSAANRVRVFVSYDLEHDGDLMDRLADHASSATSGFEISGRSTARCPTDLRDERLRQGIWEADQIIVICGERTDHSGRVGTELRIAQEEERPYFLLWGRRESMCTRPATARPLDSMYSWTPEIVRHQILTLRRLAGSGERVAEQGPAPA